MPSVETFDLIVVGGGPAGLAHAFWRLRARPELRVCVLEAAPRLGGWVRTEHVDGYQLELGPQGFRPDADVHEFLAATGLAAVGCSDSARHRFVVRDGRAHALPTGPLDLLKTRLLPWSAKLRLLVEPRVRSQSQPGESVAGFVQRRFGRHTAPLAEALMHGIYAGDAHALECATTLPTAVEIERSHGSILRGMRARRRRSQGPAKAIVCTFEGGMQRSVDALAACLGDRARVGREVRAITRADDGYRLTIADDEAPLFAREVCVTTPPAATAAMLRGCDEQLADELAAIPTASVTSTYLGYPAGVVPDAVDGFGALYPQAEAGSVLGVLFSSRVFPQQAPAGHVLFRIMSGGVRHPEEIERGDDELVAQATTTMRDRFAVRGEPTLRHVSRARNAIPQYVCGHGARLDRVRRRLAQHRGLTLRGAGYRKVSVVGQWTAEGSQP